jgi:CheY-like chemotaxis protein
MIAKAANPRNQRQFSASSSGCPRAAKAREGLYLKSILLVDDSRFMRMANEKALSKAGYSVVTASDGEEALLMAGESIPDLILLDMLLPKLGGLEVLRALRQSSLTASIPVIVMSSLSQKNDAMLIKAGATAYIEKSKMQYDQDAESLLAVVRQILDPSTMPQPAEN